MTNIEYDIRENIFRSAFEEAEDRVSESPWSKAIHGIWVQIWNQTREQLTIYIFVELGGSFEHY